MNVLITLPKHLIDAIISGEKQYEMRTVKPLMMNLKEDGFFCVEKGTDNVRCWCRCDNISEAMLRHTDYQVMARLLQVSPEYVEKYVKGKKHVYLWHIAEVVAFEEDSLCRDSLIVDRNPQQFAYCPLSYGRTY